MFKKMRFIAAAGVAGLIGCWFLCFALVTPGDRSRCQKLLQQSTVAAQTQPLSRTTAQQRFGVRKDIWAAQADNTRLHYRIQSVSSVLTLAPGEGNLSVIENLSGIKCWLQEKLYYTDAEKRAVQQMRFLEADTGTYIYTSQQFSAQSVALSVYRIPGHELTLSFDPSQCFMSGIAKDVSFRMGGQAPQFQASHFRASLNP